MDKIELKRHILVYREFISSFNDIVERDYWVVVLELRIKKKTQFSFLLKKT